jgi:predicted house-cleaning noncanonical NTP pyrophosphatase (MazG superfamily)/8-oxo-dGTP pyrophosphatase MutT (NUDIX family)
VRFLAVIDKHRLANKAFIENQRGDILILKEAESYEEGTSAGKWQLPGGRQKKGETQEEGLKREVKEETGLEIEVERPVTVGEWRPTIKEEMIQITAVFFKCKAKSTEITLSNEHTDYKWIKASKYGKYEFVGNISKRIEEFTERTDRELPKLVRDKIPEIIREKNETPVISQASGSEAEKYLREKVVEEAQEFREEGEKKELADLHAVIREYMNIKEIKTGELRKIEERKSSERGGFNQKIILEDVKDE